MKEVTKEEKKNEKNINSRETKKKHTVKKGRG